MSDRHYVLHIIKNTVLNPKQSYLGSTKDIMGRVEYFEERSIPYEQYSAEGTTDEWLLPRMKEKDLSAYTAIIFEYPRYPKTLRYIKETYPHVLCLVRAHNAELFHHFHRLCAMKTRPQDFLNIKKIKAFWQQLMLCIKRGSLDRACGRYADYILTISSWEKEHYWDKVTNKNNVVYVPFYLTQKYINTTHASLQKKNRCVCYMSSLLNPFLYHAASRYSKLVSQLDERFSDWEFVITGDTRDCDLTLTDRIKPTGFLDNPFEILAESRCIAILSHYGFGFKTKILDAIHERAYVLLPQKLYARLPSEVQPFCITVDLSDVKSFEDALKKTQNDFPSQDPNDLLKQQAFSSLDRIFNLPSPKVKETEYATTN